MLVPFEYQRAAGAQYAPAFTEPLAKVITPAYRRKDAVFHGEPAFLSGFPEVRRVEDHHLERFVLEWKVPEISDNVRCYFQDAAIDKRLIELAVVAEHDI